MTGSCTATAVREPLGRIRQNIDRLKYELETVGDVEEAIRILRTLESDLNPQIDRLGPTDCRPTAPGGAQDRDSARTGKGAVTVRRSGRKLRLFAAYALIFVAGAVFAETLQYGGVTLASAFLYR